MSEILNHKIYEDDTTSAFLGVYADRVWFHVDLREPMTPSLVKKSWDVLDSLEDNLRSRGIARYYTAVDTEDRAKFANVFGFNFTNELLNIGGFELEIMGKDI